MKTLKYFIGCFLIAIAICSCEKNEMPGYDANYAALNIWFGGGQVLDSTTYNYSYAMGEKVLNFSARVIGVPVDYDRTFEIEVYDGNINEAEGSYRTETYTIKAGETEVTCPIYFNSSLLKDKTSFTDESGVLYFRLVENKHFQQGVDKRNTLVVVLKNYLSKPDTWDDTAYPMYSNNYSYYFGNYSKKKYQFMIDKLGLVDFTISYSAQKDYDEETNTISTTYADYLKKKLQVALEEYNSDPNNPDTPLKDESGSIITF